MHTVKKRISLAFLALTLSLSAFAQTVLLKSEGREEAYVNTILSRAEKNISALNLSG